PADRQGPGPAEDPSDDDRAGPVPDAAARRPVRGADRVDRGAGAASGAAGPARRVRRAGRAHRGEPDAQRGDDPAGRRDQDGPALTQASYPGGLRGPGLDQGEPVAARDYMLDGESAGGQQPGVLL